MASEKSFSELKKKQFWKLFDLAACPAEESYALIDEISSDPESIVTSRMMKIMKKYN